MTFDDWFNNEYPRTLQVFESRHDKAYTRLDMHRAWTAAQTECLKALMSAQKGEQPD